MLNYCEVEINIGKYINYLIKNKFVVTKIINFNNGIPDEATRKKITKDIKDKLTGVEGDPVVVSFNESKENAATIEDVQVDDAQNQYEYISTEAQSKIIVGHSITSPLLIGVRDTNGFSSNADEMKSAADLFQKNVITPLQQWIAEQLNYVTGRTDLEFIALQLIEEAPAETPTETVPSALDEFIAMGEDELQGFELLHEGESGTDEMENEITGILEKEFNRQSLMSKFIEFVGTGKANPTRDSSQDSEMFAVRYKYAGNQNPERPFCQAMINAGKIYRKEDIELMKDRPVNPGFGKGGTDTYDIWLYKGGGLLSDNFKGGTCKHYWLRQIFVKSGVGDKRKANLNKQISVAEARRRGFTPTPNNRKVGTTPHSNYTSRN